MGRNVYWLAALALLSSDAMGHGKAITLSQELIAWSPDGKSCLLREKSTETAIYRLISVRSPKSSRKLVLSERRPHVDHDHANKGEKVSATRCRARLRSLGRAARRLGFKKIKLHPRRCRSKLRKELVTAPKPAVVHWKSVYERGRRAGMKLGRLRALAFDGRVMLLVDNKIRFRGEQEVQHDSPRRAPQGGLPLRNVRALISPSGHLLLLFGSPSISFEWLEVILGSKTGQPEDYKALPIP